jgi:hypothetical protein
MFDVICSVKHPFVDPIIFGQVRTEFPYSENIYNMDEYNGSKRDSTNPCDLDKSFLDTCSCCRSSKFNIDVTINDLSDDRLSETNDIIREYKPFHLVPQNLSYSSSFYDIIIPPVESVDFLIQYTPSDNVLAGAEARFNRAMPISGGIDSSFNALNRISLATRTTVINSVSGNGFNQEYVLYAPLIRFDEIGLNGGSNLLEILSGTAAGNYTCSVSEKYRVHINQGSPDTLSYPLEVGEHHFRLSNIVYTDISASIFQDNLFIFSDSNIDFTQYAVTSSWNVVISNGTNPGTYAINEILPNNTLLINAWPGANISGLSYQLKDNLSNTITSSTTGSINIQNRGRVELLDDIVNGFEVNIGYYVLYKSNQYPISGFNASNKAYVDAYSAGTAVGTANIRILKRLVDNTRGYLDTGGMRIVSGVDYEAGLGIANGHGQSTDGVADTDSKFKENYLILFNGNYYKVSQWTGTNIYISGYKVNWGLAGTPITYSIVQYNKTQNVNIEDHVFRKIDRSGNDVVTITSESVGAMLSYEGIPGFSDNVRQSEKVSFIIEKVEA